MAVKNTDITIEQLMLLSGIAEIGAVIADTSDHIELWHKGLIRWTSETEVKVSSEGMALLIVAEKKGII